MIRLDLTHHQATLLADLVEGQAEIYENPSKHDWSHNLFRNEARDAEYRTRAATLREIEATCRQALDKDRSA